MKRIKRWAAALLVAVLSFCFTSGVYAATFKDVKKDAWYFSAVNWAVEHNITSGTSTTTFSPNSTCTRAQFMTFLWRDAGSPNPKGKASFSDVKSSAYYAKAVAWASEVGICKGIEKNGKSVFLPDANITRAEAVTFLWRALGSRIDMETVHPFKDIPKGAYYETAALWMRDFGIVTGTSENTFSPNASCSRAEAVTFLYRIASKQLAGKGTPVGDLPFRCS